MTMPRLHHYIEDLRSLPRDCAVSLRHGGTGDLVLALFDRTVFRVLWGGRFLAVRAPMEAARAAAPEGVAVAKLDVAGLEELAAVSTTPKMRLLRRLADMGGICIVARRDGNVVGYVWGLHAGPAARSRYLRALPAGLFCIRTLFVCRGERGRGIATAMLVSLGEAVRASESVEVRACCALVRPGNRASLRTIAAVTGGRAEVIGEVVQLKVLRWVVARFAPTGV